MAAITVQTDAVGVTFPAAAEIYSGVANAAITAGMAVLQDANGQIGPAAATGAVWGIALESAGAGQAAAVLVRGHISGFDVSAIAPHAPAYTGAAGALDTAGTVEIGQVVALSDSFATKVIYVSA